MNDAGKKAIRGDATGAAGAAAGLPPGAASADGASAAAAGAVGGASAIGGASAAGAGVPDPEAMARNAENQATGSAKESSGYNDIQDAQQDANAKQSEVQGEADRSERQAGHATDDAESLGDAPRDVDARRSTINPDYDRDISDSTNDAQAGGRSAQSDAFAEGDRQERSASHVDDKPAVISDQERRVGEKTGAAERKVDNVTERPDDAVKDAIDKKLDE